MNLYLDEAGYSVYHIDSLNSLLDAKNLHWISKNEHGIYELVLDNQMLSTFRACPAHFMLAYVEGLFPKGGGRNWNLDFGIAFHKMIELYYNEFRKPGFKPTDWITQNASVIWNDMDMDVHFHHKEFHMIGGLAGFMSLCANYASRFSSENERLRIIGTEISFGKNKEVFIGSMGYFKLFLSGRMDIWADDGVSICPMDHKTMGTLRNDPAHRFELDEGPTGYIYATGKILESYIKANNIDPVLLKRSTNKIIMNFISKQVPKEGDRFRRVPIMKTTEQLEAYQKRMLATGEDLFKALVRYADNNVVIRDTSKCTNWYMSDCMYLPVHRQNSQSNELSVLNTFFEKKEIWDTENVNKGD